MLEGVRELTDFSGDLVIVGHSRGGCNACQAVEILKSRQLTTPYQRPQYPNITLLTFGQPHFPIDHGVVKYLTWCIMRDDPVPGISVIGAVLRAPVSAFVAYPGYTRWQVKYDSSWARAEGNHTAIECHYITFYQKVISRKVPN
jgi:hypothetical protein